MKSLAHEQQRLEAQRKAQWSNYAANKERRAAIKEHKRLVRLFELCTDPERKAILGQRANDFVANTLSKFA